METFKSKYNYVVFGLRLIFFLFFLTILFCFFFFVAPRILQSDSFTLKLFVGSLAGLFLLIFLPYRFGKVLLKQRKILTIENGVFKVSDAILNKENIIGKEDIKGFSMSKYPTKFWDFKEIILYLNNGDKIELPQFLYWNFKDIKPSLVFHGLKFLGDEPFRWKFLDSRRYQFD